MRRFVYTIKVRGVLPFPIDMLRYDRCTPDTEGDSNAIQSTLDHESKGAVEVFLQSDGRGALWQPTAGRWKSFGWEVLDVVRRAET